MFGPSYIFGVEVNRAVDQAASEVFSTPELAAKFKPTNPTPTTTPK
jgi:oligogalacturonide lyase